jgi:hypothetical protein
MPEGNAERNICCSGGVFLLVDRGIALMNATGILTRTTKSAASRRLMFIDMLSDGGTSHSGDKHS